VRNNAYGRVLTDGSFEIHNGNPLAPKIKFQPDRLTNSVILWVGDVAVASLFSVGNYWNFDLSVSGDSSLLGDAHVAGPGNQLGFFGDGPAAQQAVAGAKGGNAALGSLLTALAAYGLIVDNSGP